MNSPRQRFIQTATGRILRLGGILCLVLVSTHCATVPTGTPVPDSRRPAVATQYRQRLKQMRKNIPAITAGAEMVAKQWVERRHVLLHFPFGGDGSNFAMEMVSRAGGLDNAQLNTIRLHLRSSNDIFVCSARSWEKGGDYLRKELPRCRTNGWRTVLFASQKGLPPDLPVDILIDNGARDGREEYGAVNQIVNMTQGWMWCCELTAALTRLGQRPGILKGMLLPGATAHNKEYQRSNELPELYPCDTAIPPGQLAHAYLDAVEKELAGLEGADMQAKIGQAADLAADRVRAGGTLWAASMTHVLDGEVFWDNRSPIHAFRGISCGAKGETFTRNLKSGDLLLWFGEWTINLPWRDYLQIIRSTGADYLVSFRRGSEAMEPLEGEGQERTYQPRIDEAKMILDQHWPFEGAVVPIPFPPGKMAPVSGVHLCLLYRMLDEAIAARLPPPVPLNK